ncbi:MAG: TolC family protein [Salinivirgaceae bacterium]|jgi:outer membrane protein TolC|nr:TolC family protein [Salinivirgaceae bacterium]
MKTLILLLISLTSIFSLKAQTNVLSEYVKIGLDNNLALQQNVLSLKKAKYSLKIAKGLFLPEASLQTRYSLARGGRTIDFPIGDLMNPVYKTLNQMLEQQGQVGGFPQLENEQIAFMREQEYDAKLSLIQPLYSRSLGLNKQIAQQQLSMSESDLEIFKRELTFQIKEAYYNYLQTVQLTALVGRTKEVVNENYRVTEKLFDNNMITKDAVLRAKSDVSQVKLFETTVQKNREMAKSYFNFLINRNLNDEVKVGSSESEMLSHDINSLTESALKLREELKQLDSQTEIYSLLADLNTAENIPMLALALDAGLQGSEFSNVSDNDYVMGSLVMNWKLFNGNINRNKRQQAIIEMEKSETQKLVATQQIMLEIKRDFLDVQELKQNIEVATNRDAEAKEVYRILEKRYRQGEAALVELLDARNNMVEAESDFITIKYKLWISIARLEKSSMMTIN